MRKDDFNTIKNLKDDKFLEKRVVFLHSLEDELIPHAHAVCNYFACSAKITLFFTITGKHNKPVISPEYLNI